MSLDDALVGLFDAAVCKQGVHARQRFRGFTEHHNAAGWPVKPMGEADEGLARLVEAACHVGRSPMQ